jgi:hypothetical protein
VVELKSCARRGGLLDMRWRAAVATRGICVVRRRMSQSTSSSRMRAVSREVDRNLVVG